MKDMDTVLKESMEVGTEEEDRIRENPCETEMESPFEEEDNYTRLKKRLEYLTHIQVREDMAKDDYKQLKNELEYAKNELKKVQSVPLALGSFVEIVDEDSCIIRTDDHDNLYVKIASFIDREKLKPNCTVVVNKRSHNVVDLLSVDHDGDISIVSVENMPDVKYSDIGGLEAQKLEMREAVELPLTQTGLYTQIGIDPPRGVLMYGPPGTGKTMLAKAVASSTKAAFIKCSGTEFVQKYLGEGPRKVREIFKLAKNNAPAIIFIDEVDSIANRRTDSSQSGDREAQRILIELLNQMDGFDQTVNVKVIMATNRAETLDPALLRPGRLDRKIEFPLPDRRQKRNVFLTVTSKMNISDDVDLEDFVSRADSISCADISAICQAAGMFAIRSNRYVVNANDFMKAYKVTVKDDEEQLDFYH